MHEKEFSRIKGKIFLIKIILLMSLPTLKCTFVSIYLSLQTLRQYFYLINGQTNTFK